MFCKIDGFLLLLAKLKIYLIELSGDNDLSKSWVLFINVIEPVGEGNIPKKEFEEISDIITRFLLFPSTHLYKIS